MAALVHVPKALDRTKRDYSKPSKRCFSQGASPRLRRFEEAEGQRPLGCRSTAEVRAGPVYESLPYPRHAEECLPVEPRL
jgi:hypothetical protein